MTLLKEGVEEDEINPDIKEESPRGHKGKFSEGFLDQIKHRSRDMHDAKQYSFNSNMIKV